MIDTKKALATLIEFCPNLSAIISAIHAAGGRPLLVGGAVRDLLLGRAVKDLDIEVYHLVLADLQRVLGSFGTVIEVGKAFGVLRIAHIDIDWSLPRFDSVGRKPQVETDPNMSFEKAFARRDLTINAMGIDLLSGELIDPFNGKRDLEQKRLRAPKAHLFIEDPLRFFRVMQFISRFALYPDDELNQICATMDIVSVSRERIAAEFEKMVLQSDAPSLGLRWLQKIGRLQDVLPELQKTVGVMQNPEWHPEGDVFEHSMQTIDAAAQIVRSWPDTNKRLLLLYGALCHDLGKVTTTRVRDGKIISHGHDQAGVPFARALMERITSKKSLVDGVAKLVLYHMLPIAFVKNGARLSRYKRLAHLLAPDITLQLLADLSCADMQGRNGAGHTPLTTVNPHLEQFIVAAQKAQVLTQAELPILTGQDLLGIVAPGPKMGELLKKAYEIQLDQNIQEKDQLKRLLISEFKRKRT